VNIVTSDSQVSSDVYRHQFID